MPWDLDGRDRIADGDCDETEVVDMGAYEYSSASTGESECLVVNGGFEDDPNIIFDSPDDYGYWAGNYSEVVGVSDGITPVEGSKMLHFIHAAYGDYANESINSELWQIIDISAYAELIAAGQARAWGTASFNRVLGHQNTDTEFLVEISAYQGDPCTYNWGADELESESSSIISDSITSTWEEAQTSLLLPSDTDLIVVRIAAVENVYNDTEGVEFDGHYADAVCVTINPGRLYVDANAVGPVYDGLSWDTAYRYLQDALAATSTYPYVNEIHVAEGTYKPDEDSCTAGGTNSRNATFQLVGDVAMYGGFPNGGGDWQDRDPEQYESILSGDINTPGDANDNSFHVVTATQVDSNTILDGFVITDGNADGTYPNDRGGGMSIGTSGGLVVNDCVFTDNNAKSFGGGMIISGSSPTVTECTFMGNSGGSGAAMCNIGAAPKIVECVFIDNTGSSGGGIYNTGGSSPQFTNCRFFANTANSGGGISNVTGSPTLTNCIFSGNTASSFDGGAIRNQSDSYPVLTNCSFSGNLAGRDGGGIYSWNDSFPTITNCIFWGNTDGGVSDQSAQIAGLAPVINYSCVQGWTGSFGGTGNIGDDPLFADANGPDDIAGTEDDNIRLSVGSLCVDAGDNNSVPPDTADLDGDGNMVEPMPWDLDGHDRIADGDCNDSNVVDMGAYEFSYAFIGDFDGDCDVDLPDFAILALAWLSEAGEGQYNPDCDISLPPDEYIDWRDVKVLCNNWLAGK